MQRPGPAEQALARLLTAMRAVDRGALREALQDVHELGGYAAAVRRCPELRGPQPLHHACAAGHGNLVLLLLRSVPDGDDALNATDEHGDTAYIGACRENRGPIVRELLAKGARTDLVLKA